MSTFFIRRSAHQIDFVWGYVQIADEPLDALKHFIRERLRVTGGPTWLAAMHDMGDWTPRSLPPVANTEDSIYTIEQRNRLGPNLLTTDQVLRDYAFMCHRFGRIWLTPDLLIKEGG